jgi:hypothetical protein
MAFEVEVEWHENKSQVLVLNADTDNEAELNAINEVMDSNPDALGVQVVGIKEV